jgi:predicted phosphoribosyltransferase
MGELFSNRTEAGAELAVRLLEYAGRSDVLVLALPRGGVPVALPVACALRAPLDVFLVRKLGVPGYEELALGAIASGGVRFVNEEVRREIDLSDDVIDALAEREALELRRREVRYRGERPLPVVRDRVVILIDDGLATGATMRAAVLALRQMEPAKLIVAVPVAAPETCEVLRREADQVVCLATPDPFLAVGAWYADFSQTTDEEVTAGLEQARRRMEQDDAITSIGGWQRQ